MNLSPRRQKETVFGEISGWDSKRKISLEQERMSITGRHSNTVPGVILYMDLQWLAFYKLNDILISWNLYDIKVQNYHILYDVHIP